MHRRELPQVQCVDCTIDCCCNQPHAVTGGACLSCLPYLRFGSSHPSAPPPCRRPLQARPLTCGPSWQQTVSCAKTRQPTRSGRRRRTKPGQRGGGGRCLGGAGAARAREMQHRLGRGMRRVVRERTMRTAARVGVPLGASSSERVCVAVGALRYLSHDGRAPAAATSSECQPHSLLQNGAEPSGPCVARLR